MEEQKKEEIKELLKKSASTDHFKEHKIQREKNKEKSNSKDQKKEENRTSKVDLNKNNKKSKKEEKKSLTIPVVGIFAILLFTAIIFLFNRQNEIIEDLQSKQKKNVLNEKVLAKDESKIIKPIKEEVEVKTETIVEIKEVIKEIKVSDENLTKKKFKEFYNSRKFNKLTCYGYKAATIMPTTSCKENMKNFLEENKKAIRLEVIAVLGKDDIEAFKGIENIKLENYSKSNKLKTYALRGLARDRVLELSWQIKQILGKDTILTPTNYFVESVKNNKGILIKAYH